MRARACFLTAPDVLWLPGKRAQPICQDLPNMDYLDLVQWPAMVVTVIAAWYVASQAETRRGIGFWCFLLSNVLWIVWGWHSAAYALVVLQVCLAVLNIRGAKKNAAV